jgi:hypothetical protein
VDPVDARDREILDREGECSFGVAVKTSARAARIAPCATAMMSRPE